MPDYVVEWRIDISAENPEAAAREAWRLMRKPDSTANVFVVFDEAGDGERVDLTELEESEEIDRPPLITSG